MNPKYEDIIARLEKLGLPVAEFEFRVTKKNPPPSPPFLIYFSQEDQTGTDERNRIRKVQGYVELYTDRVPDHDLEERIEKEVFFDIDIHKTTAPIQDENTYQTAYSFNTVQKIRF